METRRDHRLNWLLGASALSNLGDGIGKVAFPLLATQATHNPLLIGGMSAAQFLPWLLFGVLTGVLLDRIDRRAAIVVANSTRAVIVGITALLVHLDAASIWVVYVSALLIGTAETVADSAGNVLIPSLVDKQRFAQANSKLQATEIVGETFLGGPVGSLTFAVFAFFPFLLNSLTYAVAAALLVAIAGNYRPEATSEFDTDTRCPASVRTELMGGLRWLRQSSLLVRLVTLAGLVSLISELAQGQLVLYALDGLGLGEAAFGIFAFVGGIGGLAGAAGASRLLNRFGNRSVLVSSIITAGAAFLAMGFTTSPVVSAGLFGLFAGAVVVVNVLLATARHNLVPTELLGRVLGVWRTVVWGTIPLGGLLGGAVTVVLDSPSGTFAVSGGLLIGVAVLAWRTPRF